MHARYAIEDPFETGYDVGHVLRDHTYHAVREEVARAFAVLADKRDGEEGTVEVLLTKSEGSGESDAEH